MIRLAICGLVVVVAGLSTGSTALAGIAEAQICDGYSAFGPKDSLNQADLKVETKDLRVRLNEKGPDLHLQLEPDPAFRPMDNGVQREGWIRVFSCEDGSLIQSLEVKGLAGPEMFLRFFQIGDVNFDGYLDVAALGEFGAKWGRQNWWLFSPAERRFISNEFTRAIGQVTANGLVLDAARRQIIAGQLTNFTGCGETKDVYSVERERLLRVHEEQISVNGDGCTLTTRDRVNGQMRVTKVRHFPPYSPATPP